MNDLIKEGKHYKLLQQSFWGIDYIRIECRSCGAVWIDKSFKFHYKECNYFSRSDLGPEKSLINIMNMMNFLKELK